MDVFLKALSFVCESLGVIGVVSFVLGTLSVVGLLDRVERGLVLANNAVRARMNLSGAQAARKFGHVIWGTIVVALVFLIAPVILPALIFLFATRWSPTSLAFQPIYGIAALIPMGIFLLALLNSKFRQGLRRRWSGESSYVKLIIWCYGLVVVGLLGPAISLRVFDLVLPVNFYIAILLMLTIAFYAYAFGNLGFAIAFAILGLGYLIVRVLTGVVSYMTQFRAGMTGIVAYAISAVAFIVERYDLCSCLGSGC